MGKFTPSYSGIGELLRADFIEADMVERAFKVLARAEATAPYDVKDRDGSHYRDDFTVESTSHGGYRGDRAEASVVNGNSVALMVEFGNKNTPKHRTLGKALDSAGDFLTLQNAASLLGLSTSDVTELAKRGVLSSVRASRQQRISKESVTRLLGTGFVGDYHAPKRAKFIGPRRPPKPRKPKG
ncbi:MAG TPA: HK97 gp10 family phage protein [Acidothermaceae bacterium]